MIWRFRWWVNFRNSIRYLRQPLYPPWKKIWIWVISSCIENPDKLLVNLMREHFQLLWTFKRYLTTRRNLSSYLLMCFLSVIEHLRPMAGAKEESQVEFLVFPITSAWAFYRHFRDTNFTESWGIRNDKLKEIYLLFEEFHTA